MISGSNQGNFRVISGSIQWNLGVDMINSRVDLMVSWGRYEAFLGSIQGDLTWTQLLETDDFTLDLLLETNHLTLIQPLLSKGQLLGSTSLKLFYAASSIDQFLAALIQTVLETDDLTSTLHHRSCCL